MSQPFLTVTIVHFNTPLLLQKCIYSCAAHIPTGGLPLAINVVDNASVFPAQFLREWIALQKNNPDLWSQKFPELKNVQLHLIENTQNIGFGKAQNQAIKAAQSEWVLILNPDSELCNSIQPLLNQLQRSPEIGLIGPKIIFPDGRIQRACRRNLPQVGMAIKHFFLRRLLPQDSAGYHLGSSDYETAGWTEAISGSFMLANRQLLQDMGGFDESFFMYGEDLDLCLRMKQKKRRIYYEPQVLVRHTKGASHHTNFYQIQNEYYRSMVLYFKKHFTHLLWLLPLVHLAILILKLRLRLQMSMNQRTSLVSRD